MFRRMCSAVLALVAEYSVPFQSLFFKYLLTQVNPIQGSCVDFVRGSE
jgi:hypothetical protein